MTTWIDLAGWTLLHFVWQGALIAALAAPGLRLLRGPSPRARYAVACAALIAMLIAPIVTAVAVSGDDARVTTPTAPDGQRPAATAATLTQPPVSDRTAVPEEHASAGAMSVDALLPTLVLGWLSGVSILLLRLAGGCWRVRRLHRLALAEPPSRWQSAADAIARRLRLARPVFIVDSIRVDTPTVIGWLKPVIVLPVAAIANLTPAQVDAILAHELAHIRRHDFAVNVLQTIAETLLFYHPAVWWVSGRLRLEREHCCDDVAVATCGDAVAYASALTELAAWQVRGMPLAVAATGGSLLTRVRRLLNSPSDGAPRSASGLLALGLALALLVVIGSVRALTMAQSPPDSGASDSRFGPPQVNELLGFELFPYPKQWATDDPRGAAAWRVTINYPSTEMPMIGFTGRSLLRHAFGTPAMPIVNLPTWVDRESFDLSATTDVPITAGIADPEGLQGVLRDLLERELGITAHVETREFPVYALVRDGSGALGPSMRPSTAACMAGRNLRDPVIQQLHARGERVEFCGIEDSLFGPTAVGVTMTEFAEAMAGMSPLRPDRPVVDRTGLTEKYDFTVRLGLLPIAAIAYGHPAFGALVQPFGVRSVYTALPEQLGLRLVESTAPFDVLVIGRINRPRS